MTGTSHPILLDIISVTIIVFFLVYLFVLHNKRKKEKDLHDSKLFEIETKAYTSQMSPHFIYNSLSTLQHLIMNDEKQKAFDYVSEFSLLMRQTLDNSRKSYVSLDDEISFLKRYVGLEKFRFGSSFDYQFNIDAPLKTNNYNIQPMLIQPIIENAIKHGLAPKKEGGFLNVSFYLRDDMLECIVDDNGIGWKKSNDSISIGHESKA